MPDWDDRWEYIIELGRELPALDPTHCTSENLVHGCMSTVWLVVMGNHEEGSKSKGTVAILADSDSLIVKGLIVVLLGFYEGKSPAEIIQSDERALFTALGLDQHLSPNRRNGLFAMVQKIKQLTTECLAAN